MSLLKIECGKWSAIHDFIPPLPARLSVSGECHAPTPGYEITLEKAVPQGINPSILILTKTVTPPTGVEPQHPTTEKVSYYEKTNEHYTEVTIVPDNVTIKVQEVS